MLAIRTKYFGPPNVRGSRIQAQCKAKTIYVPYDHALNSDENHRAACKKLLSIMGWGAPMVGGTFANDMYWVFRNDMTTKESA
jgi:hypothetical protein